MARQINKLSARGVAGQLKPGRHGDGGGLYLQVDASGAKRWVFLFRLDGRSREMGLGGLDAVPLARARELASAARQRIAAGLDPIEVRKAVRAVPTFGELADEVVAGLRSGWRNPKHAAQWEMTLKVYAAPIRAKRVDQITTDDVLRVLRPIWTSKPETASRLRGRIEAVLDAARARGLTTSENPARWRGGLAHLLPKAQKLNRGHHMALLYASVPEFMGRLLERESISAIALGFTILTAARTGETIGAKWSEIDLEAKVWTIPAARMKAGREHRVPLSTGAVELLAEAEKLADGGEYIFPGPTAKRPLSNMAMLMLLRGMQPDITVHGFRSSFRDWVGEQTDHPRELAEQSLAHTVGSDVERAYRRGDALEKRRRLMQDWSDYCMGVEARDEGEADAEAA